MDLSIARWIEGMRYSNVENEQKQQKLNDFRPNNDDNWRSNNENEVKLTKLNSKWQTISN